jgi:very-short-patch-repair endonuclease
MRRRAPWLDATAGRQAADDLGAEQSRVVSRGQLVRARVPRWLVRAEVRAGRWQLPSEQTVVLHNGPLGQAELRWVAVLGTSPRAALDGVTALQEAGVELSDIDIHVIVPKGSEVRQVRNVVVHESRRYRTDDLVKVGIPRTRPAVAAVHAALWAVSDRQAKLFFLMCVQQRRSSLDQLETALSAVRRAPRLKLLRELLVDMRGGVQSLGELDVAQDFRRRGLPEPDRQVVRRRESGTEYLDCRFAAYELVLEIDGAGHDAPDKRLADLLRDLSVIADGETTIRLPLAIYHLDRERVLDHLERVLVARGWHGRPEAA